MARSRNARFSLMSVIWEAVGSPMPPISEIQPSYDAQDFAWFFFGNVANDSGPNED